MPVEVPREFHDEFQFAVSAPETTVQYFLNETADLCRGEEGERYVIDPVDHKYGQGFSVRVSSTRGGGGSIGLIFLLSTPSGRTNVRVPPGRGSGVPESTNEYDPDGRLFGHFLQVFGNEVLQQGLITSSKRFESATALETAERSLAAANDSAGYAAVANICRTALIKLANETYSDSMLPRGTSEPKGDDATAKLRLAVRHFMSSSDERQKEGLTKVIEGAWGYCSAFLHRKNGSESEAEVCVGLTATVFECLALVIP